MKSFEVVLIDGDSIAYKAGAASSCQDALQAARNLMYQIMEDTGCYQYELWLEDWQGKNIFRNKFAVTKPYKGNRLDKPKPEFLNEVRTFLKLTYNAKLTSDYESEDRVLIRAYEIGIDDCIIAHIDKDLLQYPLTFYNYYNRSMCRLSKKRAEYNLWKQVLTGDHGDHIPGLPGCGSVKADKILLKTNSENYPKCAAKAYKNKGYEYKYFIEQYNLIKLRNYISDEVLIPVWLKEWIDL